MGLLDLLEQTAGNVATAYTDPLGYLQGLGGQVVSGLAGLRDYTGQNEGSNYVGPQPSSDAWNLSVRMGGGDPTAPLTDPVNNLQTYMGYLGGSGFAAPFKAGESIKVLPRLRRFAPQSVIDSIRAAQRAMAAAGKKPSGMRPSYSVRAEGPGSFISERPIAPASRPVPKTTPEPMTQGGFFSAEDRALGERLAREAEASLPGGADVNPFELGIGRKRSAGADLLDVLFGLGRAAGAGAEFISKIPGTLISEIARGPLATRALKEFGAAPSNVASRAVKKSGSWLDDLLARGTDYPTSSITPGTFTQHLGRVEPYKSMARSSDIATPGVREAYESLPTGSAGRDVIQGLTRAFSRPSGETWKSILGALGFGAPLAYQMGTGLGEAFGKYGVEGLGDFMLPKTLEETQAEEFDREARQYERDRFLNRMAQMGLGAPAGAYD